MRLLTKTLGTFWRSHLTGNWNSETTDTETASLEQLSTVIKILQVGKQQENDTLNAEIIQILIQNQIQQGQQVQFDLKTKPDEGIQHQTVEHRHEASNVSLIWQKTICSLDQDKTKLSLMKRKLFNRRLFFSKMLLWWTKCFRPSRRVWYSKEKSVNKRIVTEQRRMLRWKIERYRVSL